MTSEEREATEGLPYPKAPDESGNYQSRVFASLRMTSEETARRCSCAWHLFIFGAFGSVMCAVAPYTLPFIPSHQGRGKSYSLSPQWERGGGEGSPLLLLLKLRVHNLLAGGRVRRLA